MHDVLLHGKMSFRTPDQISPRGQHRFARPRIINREDFSAADSYSTTALDGNL